MSSSRLRFAALVVASAALITSFTQTLLVPVLPDLPRQLGTTASTSSWLVTITVVVGAVANPLLGGFGDRFGRSRMLLVAIGAFVVGSVLCAVTTDLAVLLVGRAIQGLSAAAIPLGVGIMAHLAPPDRRASGIALVSAMVGVGGAVGLPLAGLLAAAWGLAGVFWTSAGIGAGVLVATIFLVPDVRPAGPVRGRLDWIGTLLLATGVATTLIPTSQGATWGWTSGPTLGLFGLAAILLPAFCWYELRTSDPVVDIRLAATRSTLLTNVAGLALGAGFFISFLSAITILQTPAGPGEGFGLTVVEAGWLMLPGGGAMALAAPLGARMVSRHGSRSALLVACAIVATGFAIQIAPRAQVWQLVCSTVVVAAGIAVAYSAMPALVLDTAPSHQAAEASGVNALARNLGSALGTALFGLAAGVSHPSAAGYTTLYLAGAAMAVIALTAALAIRHPAQH
jgi:predicted MFS family arabinose efflux permease